MDEQTRNLLRNTVVQCRKLLEEDLLDQLQGIFGIHQDGRIEPESALPNLDEEGLEVRRRAVAAVEHIQVYGVTPADAVDQFLREIAFTHLNRLCAFKMLERRGLLEETVSRGANSNGFKVYLAGHPEDERLWQTGNDYQAYRHFLFDVCAQLSEEIKVLFDTEHISSHLYPDRRALEGVLDLVNAEPLEGIWDDDETIGWIYQYFTPKEQRTKARKESAAPRNSYELAFLNQFFTPRYVVQFLTDNTLGRTWYEMRKGQTRLSEQCEYMVHRPTEIFLGQGEEPPPEPERNGDLSQEELLKQPVHVPHREKKFPWEIKVLDPACGSGHFLLYAFDLLETIYDEAYDDPDIGPRVQLLHPDPAKYLASVPAMILRYNLHGIDIDLRSTQIAALALWLRAQRSYQRLGLKDENRPQIDKTNMVCAEPMPGDEGLLTEFCESLEPSLLGDLVHIVWDKMKLAGEAGFLLKIEVEIRDIVQQAQDDWRTAPKGYNVSLFDGTVQRSEEQKNFDFSEVSTPEFWQKAEALLLDALELFASRAANKNRYDRHLFKDDVEQGFAFIALCRRRYDAVLMNPPFGEYPASFKELSKRQYHSGGQDISTAFVERGLMLRTANGLMGAITSRTVFFMPTTKNWRQDVLLRHQNLLWAELGEGVLDDAMVETCMYVCQDLRSGSPSLFINPRGLDIRAVISAIYSGDVPVDILYLLEANALEVLPGSPLAYWVSPEVLDCFKKLPSLEEKEIFVRVGLQTGDDFRFIRCWWEVPLGRSRWLPHAKGGENLPYAADIHLVVDWQDNGSEMKALPSIRLNMYSQRDPASGLEAGLTFPYRTHRFSPAVMPKGVIAGVAGMNISSREIDPFVIVALLNSSVINEFIATRLGQLEINSLYQAGSISPVPYPELSNLDYEELRVHGKDLFRKAFTRLSHNENFFLFELGNFGAIGSLSSCASQQDDNLKKITEGIYSSYQQVDKIASNSYGISSALHNSISKSHFVKFKKSFSSDGQTALEYTRSLVSVAIGMILGRWDVRMALNSMLAPQLFDPLAPLPVCPPSMLVRQNGHPAGAGGIVSEEWLRMRQNTSTLPPENSVGRPTIPDGEYPLQIAWDGILVDDPDHQDDIVRRMRGVLELLWNDPESIELEVREIIGVNVLRDYFRNPKHFWEEHIRRYSKSRRKAPIYWLLQSPRRHYALWLYFHRLDRDMLYKALRNYVDPKHRLEESRLQEIRARLPATQDGRDRKALEKQIEDQEDIVNDVLDFKERLEKVAALGLDPDLNDGVVLNIAPLHELVPWKEPKKYWDELLAGKYEWSSIGKQLRERGVVRG